MAHEDYVGTAQAVPGIPQAIRDLPSDVMQISDKMILLTWLAFALVAIVLHKLLWKPILGAVANRERSVGEALAGAERARNEIALAEDRKREIAEEAAEKARQIAERANRDAAAAVARADREINALTQRKMEAAEQAIMAEQRKAFEAVRRDAAEHLTDALETFLRNDLTPEQKRAYQDSVINEVAL